MSRMIPSRLLIPRQMIHFPHVLGNEKHYIGFLFTEFLSYKSLVLLVGRDRHPHEAPCFGGMEIWHYLYVHYFILHAKHHHSIYLMRVNVSGTSRQLTEISGFGYHLGRSDIHPIRELVKCVQVNPDPGWKCTHHYHRFNQRSCEMLTLCLKIRL